MMVLFKTLWNKFFHGSNDNSELDSESNESKPKSKFGSALELLNSILLTHQEQCRVIGDSLRTQIPDIDTKLTIIVITRDGEYRYDTTMSVYSLTECITNTQIMSDMLTYVAGIGNSQHKSKNIAIVWSYGDYVVHSCTLKNDFITFKTYDPDHFTPNNALVINRIMKSAKWELIASTVQYTGDIDTLCKDYYNRCYRYYEIPEYISLTFSMAKFINVSFMMSLIGNHSISNVSLALSNGCYALVLKVTADDSIELINDRIKQINEYINNLFIQEQKFLTDNLLSIISITYSDGNTYIMHTSNSDNVILNDSKLEYTDLFTGLRNTIMLQSNVLRITQDDMKPKYTTLLPKAHMNLFNQNPINQLELK